jgi:hypothetical protein
MKRHFPQTSDSAPKPAREQISVAAYHLFLERGGVHGHDLDDWLRAERLLTERLIEAANEHENGASVRMSIPTAKGMRPLDAREYPLARDERGSASREEIRLKGRNASLEANH